MFGPIGCRVRPTGRRTGVARVYDADASRPTYRFIRGNENNPDTSVTLQPAIPQLFGKTDLKIEPVSLPVEAYFPDGRSFVPDDLDAEAKAKIEKAEADLKKAREKPEAAARHCSGGEASRSGQGGVPALEARIKADLAAMATPVPPEVEQLGEEARKLERAANYLKADADVILAKYELEQADDKREEARRRDHQTGGSRQGAEGARRGLHVDRPEIPDHKYRPPARARPLDRRQGQSVNSSCRHQSHLAAPLRKAACPDSFQFRQKRQEAVASRNYWTGLRSSSWIVTGT